MSPRAETRALLALLVGGAAIAFVPVCVRLSVVGPNATAFWRLAIALPILAAGRRFEPPTSGFSLARRDLIGLVVAGLCFAGDLGAWHWCIRLTAIANATILPNLAPIFVTVGARLVFGERIRGGFAVALAIALAGVWVLLGSSPTSNQPLLGDLLGLAAAAFYGGYLLTVQHLRTNLSTGTVLLGSGVISMLTLFALTLLAGEAWLPTTPSGWMPLVVLGVLHVAGQGLIGHALATLPASFISVGLMIQPIGAAMLAAMFFGEALGIRQAGGATLIFAGIALARRAQLTPR